MAAAGKKKCTTKSNLIKRMTWNTIQMWFIYRVAPWPRKNKRNEMYTKTIKYYITRYGQKGFIHYYMKFFGTHEIELVGGRGNQKQSSFRW